MANTPNRRLGRASLLGATLIWGSSFIILKSTLDTVPTLWVLALRFTGAALLMAVIGWKELRQLVHRSTRNRMKYFFAQFVEFFPPTNKLLLFVKFRVKFIELSLKNICVRKRLTSVIQCRKDS